MGVEVFTLRRYDCFILARTWVIFAGQRVVFRNVRLEYFPRHLALLEIDHSAVLPRGRVVRVITGWAYCVVAEAGIRIL